MAYAFNAGTEKEIIISRYCSGGYLTGDASDWYSGYFWFCEYPIKFNVSPFAKAYYNDNSKNNVTLLKFAGGTSANYYMGLHFEQLNDAIKVYWRSGTNYTSALLYEIPITALDNPKYILIIYDVSHRTGDSDNSVRLIYGANFESISVVNFSVGKTQGRTGLIAETGSTVDITTTPSDGRVYDDRESGYSWTSVFATTESYYGTAPRFGFKWPSNNPISVTLQSPANLQSANGDAPDPYTPVPPDEPPFDPTEDPEPYDPSKDDTSDLVNIPGNPLIGVTSAGFINVYNPGIRALQGLGDILFPNVASAADIVEAVIKLCETLANQNLINYVIDCHIIPVQPQIGANASIKVGFRDTGISVPTVTNDYIDATCGSLNIREYFGGFQDFLATRSKLYLPFIGFVDVRPEYWQGGTLSVDYKFNVIDGSFMCYIRSVSSKSQLNGSVIAQYAGNACLHLPVTGVNYAQMVSGIVGAAVTMASGGGSTAVLGGALSAANTIAAGGNVQQSNGYSSTAALMGVRTPFLLIERAVPAYSAKYAHDKGFPTNIATLLSNVSGYTEISDIDLTGLPFTADELTELRQLLAEGVYF